MGEKSNTNRYTIVSAPLGSEANTISNAVNSTNNEAITAFDL